jgi:hypothetical protein
VSGRASEFVVERDMNQPFDSRESDDRRESSRTALAADSGNDYLSVLSQSPFHKSHSSEYALGAISRVLLICWSLFLCAGFALAASLQPNSQGFGTHQSLGFPPCTFRILLDIPCPSCGMTTSFAHFMRAEIPQAARANVAGLLLAITCLIQIPWCCYSAVRGRLWKVDDPVRFTLIIVGGLSAVALINWGRQLI